MSHRFVLIVLLGISMLWSCGRTPAPSTAPDAATADSVPAVQVEVAMPDSVSASPPIPTPTPMPQSDGAQTLSAQFVEIQMGDYAHLVVRDAAGKRRTFYFSDDLPYSAWADLDTLPAMKGKRLELKWRHVTKYLDASGSKEGIDEVYEIRYP